MKKGAPIDIKDELTMVPGENGSTVWTDGKPINEDDWTEEQREDYEALEKKHLGDSEKGTGVYAATGGPLNEDGENQGAIG